MSFDAVRISLSDKVVAVLAAFDASIATQFENQETKDMNNVAEFVYCCVHWIDGSQVSLEQLPRTRYNGELQLYVFGKAGAGTKRLNEIEWALAEGLKYQKVGAAQLKAPRPLPGAEHGDWFNKPLMLSFYTDVM